MKSVVVVTVVFKAFIFNRKIMLRINSGTNQMFPGPVNHLNDQQSQKNLVGDRQLVKSDMEQSQLMARLANT